jgi:hypothetical protein
MPKSPLVFARIPKPLKAEVSRCAKLLGVPWTALLRLALVDFCRRIRRNEVER